MTDKDETLRLPLSTHREVVAIYTDRIVKLQETLLNVVTAVEKERKLSGKGKQLPVIKEAYNLLKSIK